MSLHSCQVRRLVPACYDLELCNVEFVERYCANCSGNSSCLIVSVGSFTKL